MDNYSIMITSKYFESIEDFINLEIAVKRFSGNMDRFHFNPLALNNKTRKFFTNLETLHLYDECDEIFEDGRIFKHCIWHKLNYEKYLFENEKGNDCICICYTKRNRFQYGNEIPKNVKILEDGCFGYCYKLLSIKIPESVTQIGDYCFKDCISLTAITIPSTVSKIGSSCFINCVSLRKIEIQPLVRKLKKNFFYNCTSLTSITIPDSVVKFGKDCFYNCHDFTLTEAPLL